MCVCVYVLAPILDALLQLWQRFQQLMFPDRDTFTHLKLCKRAIHCYKLWIVVNIHVREKDKLWESIFHAFAIMQVMNLNVATFWDLACHHYEPSECAYVSINEVACYRRTREGALCPPYRHLSVLKFA